MQSEDTSHPPDFIVRSLRASGIDLVACLPDMWLKGTIDRIAQAGDMQLVRVAREEDAISLCAGAYLGGRKAAVVMQNAGALLAINALSAFSNLHRMPVLMLLAHRGGPDDNQYYQTYKYRVCADVLRSAQVVVHDLPTTQGLPRLPGMLEHAWLARNPTAILMGRDALMGQGGS